jgi:hypothetical protein
MTPAKFSERCKRSFEHRPDGAGPRANRRGRNCSALTAPMATGCAGFVPTFTTLAAGLLADCKAFRKNHLGPATPRFAVSKKSIVWPVESNAR